LRVEPVVVATERGGTPHRDAVGDPARNRGDDGLRLGILDHPLGGNGRGHR